MFGSEAGLSADFYFLPGRSPPGLEGVTLKREVASQGVGHHIGIEQEEIGRGVPFHAPTLSRGIFGKAPNGRVR